VNLASSTMVPEGLSPTEAIGIIVSYTVRVKLNCGALGGELVTDVPFKLLHPAPGNCSPYSRDDESISSLSSFYSRVRSYRPPLWSEFLTTDSGVPGSIPGHYKKK
jgi:hypothetical protein